MRSASKSVLIAFFWIVGVYAVGQAPQGLCEEKLRGEPKYWLAVDPFSTGSLYTKELIARGYKVISVRSAEETPSVYWGYDSKEFEKEFRAWEYDSAESLAKALSGYSFVGTFLGIDRGVYLHDRLCKILSLPANDPESSAIRRDKYEMGQALGDVEQVRSGDLGELLRWVRGRGQWPVAMKVLKGAGSDGFALVYNEDQLEKRYRRLIHTRDSVGNPISEFLVQEYLDGTVLAFNTVSMDPDRLTLEQKQSLFPEGVPENAFYITDLMRYQLELVDLPEGGKSIIYRSSEVLSPEDEVIEAVTPYASSILKRLHHRNGMGHTEIMDLGPSAKGPRFKAIELNPRGIGAGLTRLVEAATGENPIQLHIESMIDPVAFARRLGKGYHNYTTDIRKRFRPSRVVLLASKEAGEVTQVRKLDEIQSLPSFLWHRGIEGRKISQVSIDLASSRGMVFLTHPDREILNSDQARLERWNGDGEIFQVKPH